MLILRGEKNMTEKTYEIAKDLIEDIDRIETYVDEVENYHHWITISTPNYKNLTCSLRFQRELVEWLISKKEEYQKEFEAL